jgi:tetrahydromethanopterin S-methyltransferase subunit E
MFHSSFRAFRLQHPLARLLVGIAGLVAAAILVALGLFALVALAIGGGIFVLVRALRSASSSRSRPGSSSAQAPSSAPPGVIEGEFTVVPGVPVRDAPAPSSR